MTGDSRQGRGFLVVVGWHLAIVVAAALWVLSLSGDTGEAETTCGGWGLFCDTSAREVGLYAALLTVPAVLAVSAPAAVVVLFAVAKRVRSGLVAGVAANLAGLLAVAAVALLLVVR